MQCSAVQRSARDATVCVRAVLAASTSSSRYVLLRTSRRAPGRLRIYEGEHAWPPRGCSLQLSLVAPLPKRNSSTGTRHGLVSGRGAGVEERATRAIGRRIREIPTATRSLFFFFFSFLFRLPPSDLGWPRIFCLAKGQEQKPEGSWRRELDGGPAGARDRERPPHPPTAAGGGPQLVFSFLSHRPPRDPDIRRAIVSYHGGR